jgi:hypothetical protein
LEGLDVFVPENNFISVQEVAWRDHHKLHRGSLLAYQCPEDLERYHAVGRFQFKNIEVPQANEAEGKVQDELFGVGSVLLE